MKSHLAITAGASLPTKENAPATDRGAENEHRNSEGTLNGDQAQRKRLATLRAALARKGFELVPTAIGTFIVSRWNLTRELQTEAEIEGFARQVGAAL